jgi:hypothetical protein
MREFIGEQYLPADDAKAAVRRAALARAAADQVRSEGTLVHYVRSIFIPEDETCLHMYRAVSLEAVKAAAARAPLPLDRIAEAIIETGTSDGSVVRGLA